MKKLLIVGMIFTMVFVFGSLAMAKSNPQFPCPNSTTGLTANTDDPAQVCFDWDDWAYEGTPVKYSIDVELLVAGETWDAEDAEIQDLSFGTGCRMDEAPISQTDLCVPVGEFVYDDDGDSLTDPVPCQGAARAKIKALGKGGKGRSQNNCFSEWTLDFTVGGEIPPIR